MPQEANTVEVIYMSNNFPTYAWNIPYTPNQQFMFRNSNLIPEVGDAWDMLTRNFGEGFS